MRFCFFVCALLFATAASADPLFDLTQFAQYADDGVAALQAGELARAEDDFASAIPYGPQRSRVLFELGLVQAKRGEKAKALESLSRFAEFGMAADLSTADFASLRGEPEFARIRARVAEASAPLCPCNRLYQGSDAPFIAEGVAQDIRTGRLFVSSVHERKIVTIQNGVQRDFAQAPDGMSILGIHINAAHDILWAAAAPMVQGGATELDGSALLAFDITSGALRARYDAPIAPAGGKRAFNDLAIAQDGTIYVSDADDGSIFRLKPGAQALELVGDAARFKSPQGMVVSADGNTLLVADYSMGLISFDVKTGLLTPVEIPRGVTTLVFDGLVQLHDGSFVATQNGVSPARIVHFRLSADWSRLKSFSVIARGTADIADPSLLAVDGNDVLVSGVAQWAAFDEDKHDPVRAVLPWKIVRVTVK